MSDQRRQRAAGLLPAMVLALVGCGAQGISPSASGGGSCSDTLRTAFYVDMQVPDPDIFYETEGLQVTLAAYEGLLQYDPADTNVIGAGIVPLIASAYTVSDDAKTYTFTLDPAAKFADGTKVTSADVQWSFERRTAVNQGPAYMLAQVDSYETPDDGTFVVHLTQPVSAFLDFMAAPYGPKVMNKKLIEANIVNDDWGQAWIATHSAGTGPYQISSFEVGNEYKLERNANYWQGTPNFATISIKIVPDSSSQQLQLENGDLDIVHNFPPATAANFSSKAGFQVIQVPSLLKQDIKINPNKAPFDDKAIREAFRQALDRDALVQQVWGDFATPSTQMLPKAMLPDGTGMDTWTVDKTALAAAASRLSDADKKVEIVHQIGLIGDQQMAEAVQAVLLDAGFAATVKAVPVSETFQYRDADPASVPNIVLQSNTPDAAHPETYAGVYYRTDAFLNFLKGGSTQADDLMNQGLAATSKEAADQAYGGAMDAVHDSATFITLADQIYAFIAKAGFTGFAMNAAAPTQLNLTTAKLCG